jgi:hypothetical protein
MTSATGLSAIGSLILVRLLAAGDQGEAASKIRKDLEPLLGHRDSGAAPADEVDRALDGLEASGLVASRPGKSRKAAPKIAATAEGRRRGLEFLGVAQLRPKTTWTVLRKTYLPAGALGLPAAGEAAFKALASEPGFKAALLKRQYDLPIAELPKLDDALDALAWKLMGFEGEGRKFTVKNVKTALLNRELGDGRATDFKKAASRLLAQRCGARRDDPKEIRDAVVRRWLDRRSGAGPAPSPPAVRTPGPEPGMLHPGPLDAPALAERVKAAARACPTGRYGDSKVFIAHVWRMLESDPDFAGMGLDGFKQFLGEANNARLLDLGRADLVQAMDPDEVRSSEVRYLNATFHFIRI